jgi:uncharacterized protein (DUF305 family)
MMKQLIALACVLMTGVFVYADAPTDGRVGRAEIRFMEGMIDHHQMALDMANDCLGKASDAVKTICEAVIVAQTPEIEQMQAWLLAWYNIEYTPMPMAEAMGDMDMGAHSGHSMSGMPDTDPAMMMGMFAGFNRWTGAEYDQAWLESMIDHHDDAIHMSQRLLDRLGEGGHAELKTLAESIITAQTAEIEQMGTLLPTIQ